MSNTANLTSDQESINKLKKITDDVFNNLDLELNQLSAQVTKAAKELPNER